MNIAIDTLFMSSRLRYTGTGKYLRHLLSASLEIVAREHLDIVFHGFADPAENWADKGLVSPILRVHEARAMRQRRIWLLGGMAMHTARVRPEVVFSPTAHSSIAYPFVPLVSTILDAIPARLPAGLVDGGRAAHYLTRISARLATKVLTISLWSKQDLVDVYGLNPDKIEVIYPGYDKGLYNESPPDPDQSAVLLKRLGIRPPFVLHHGMVQLRKNLPRLIQAWDRVRESSQHRETQLVLAGPMGHGHEDILKARQVSPNREDIILTGPLRDDELALVLKSAFLCVIPSLYEGFCLPMVEAMACGVPTVASGSSCIPEVSGNVLEYFDPYSVEEMAEAIRNGLEDSDLGERLRQRGLVRSAEFSWERCAQETLDVFSRPFANV